jgi:hypothetical protein
VVEVVGQPDPYAAVDGADKGGSHHVRGRPVQAQVVEREIEARPGRVDEGGDRVRNLVRRLAPVGQETELEAVVLPDYPCSARRLAL